MYRASIDAHLRGAVEVPARTAELFALDYYDRDCMNIIPNYMDDKQLSEQAVSNDDDDDSELSRVTRFTKSLQPHYLLVFELNARNVRFLWDLQKPQSLHFSTFR